MELESIKFLTEVGAIGLAFYLIRVGQKERQENSKERKQILKNSNTALSSFRKVVSNHMHTQQEIDREIMKTLQDLTSAVKGLSKNKGK